MKKILLALSVLLALILTSCDAFIEPQNLEKPKIYYVGIGLDYRTWNRAEDSAIGRSHLRNTKNDLQAITAQFELLADKAGYDYRFVTYDDFRSDDVVKVANGEDQFNYNFYFNSWSKDGEEAIIDDEFLYKNIANNQVDEDGNPINVSLRDFAKEFTDNLKRHLTYDGKYTPGKNDIIIFYYTGHGIENGLGPALYYQTGDRSEEERMMASWDFERESIGASDQNYIIPLPYIYLDEYFFSDYDATIVTLFDCCYSGYAINNSSLGSIHNFKTNSWNNSVRDDILQVPSINSIFTNTYLATFSKEDARKNVYHLTAAHATQTSFDKDFNAALPNQDKFGAFTYQILDYFDYDFGGIPQNRGTANTPYAEHGCAGDPNRKIYSVTDLYTHIFNNIGYDTKTYATPNVTRSRFDVALFMM